MQLITGGKLKPTIAVCCCLFITVTNCDKKLLENSDYLATSDNRNHQPLRRNVDSLRQPDTPITRTPVNSVTEKINQPKSLTDSVNNSNNAKHETSNTTSKVTNSLKVNTGENANSTTSTTREPGISSNIEPPNSEGALLRGASVFLGLSIVVIAYIIFRCARLNKNRTQMVRKYGILAHRQDVEMRPLPLDDEDEDDTTVFDASEVAGIHDKQRRTT